jgi:hypothetical protein
MDKIISYFTINGPVLAAFIAAFIAALIAILSWFVAHRLTASRDRENKRREQRIGYLIEAYRRLELCAHRGNHLEFSKIESAVADIQLFGTTQQVKLVQTLTSEFASGGSASMDALLQDLRRDLRAELMLEVVPDKILHIRMQDKVETRA